VSDWPHELQHPSLPCPSLSPGVCSNSCHWVSDDIQSFHLLLLPSPLALNLSQHQGEMFKELNIWSERTFNTDSYSSVKLKISTCLSGERFFSILLQNRKLSQVYFLKSFNFQNLKDFRGWRSGNVKNSKTWRILNLSVQALFLNDFLTSITK